MLPRSILTSVPRPVRIVILDDAGLFFYNLSPRASAGHRRTQEDVDDEHDEEEDSESDGQPEEPGRMDGSVLAKLRHQRRLAGIHDEDARCGHQDAFVGAERLEGR